MATVADVDRNLAMNGVKHRVPCVALHVVRALVEVAHSRNVVLPVFAEHAAISVDHNSRVPQCARVFLISFQDRRYDHHAPFLCQWGQKRGTWALHCMY